jgi:hypothetical protein
MQENEQEGRWACRWMSRQEDEQAGRWAGRKMSRQEDEQAGSWAGGNMNRQEELERSESTDGAVQERLMFRKIHKKPELFFRRVLQAFFWQDNKRQVGDRQKKKKKTGRQEAQEQGI